MFSAADELLKLDNQICFKLYAASRAMTKLYRPLLSKLNLTYPQYLVLLVLWQRQSESPQDPCPTLREIGEELHLDSGTLTPLLKRMEQDGLLKRQKAAEDGREILIQLTDQGTALKTEAVEVPTTLICSENFPVNEIPQIHNTLNQLLTALWKEEE